MQTELRYGRINGNEKYHPLRLILHAEIVSANCRQKEPDLQRRTQAAELKNSEVMLLIAKIRSETA